MRLQGKVVVVTGGGSGIGFAICERVVREGGVAVVADINASTAQQVARRLGETRAQAVEMDVGSKESVEAAFEEILKRHGRTFVELCPATILTLNLKHVECVEHHDLIVLL